MLPFVIGAIVGAAAMRLTQNKLPAQPLQKAGESLRKTGVAGLSALERSSAQLRNRLEGDSAVLQPDDASSHDMPAGDNT